MGLYKIILLLVLVPNLLFGDDNIGLAIKTKAKSNDGIVQAKVLMKTFEKYEQISLDHITNLTAQVGKKVVLNISISSFLSRFPIIKHKFKDIPSKDWIEYTLSTNSGQSIQSHFKIKRKPSRRAEPFVSLDKMTNKGSKYINEKAWDEKTIKGALKALYGYTENKDTIEEKQQYINFKKTSGFCKPEECNHDSRYPVKVFIESNKQLESIAILSNSTSRALLAVIEVEKDAIIDFEMPFQKFKKNGKLIVVAKGKDGVLYKSSAYNILTGTKGELDFFSPMYFNFKE